MLLSRSDHVSYFEIIQRQLSVKKGILWGPWISFHILNGTASAALHFVVGSDTLMAVGIRYSVRGVRNGRK